MHEIKSVFWIGTFVMLFFACCLIFLVLFYKNYFFRMKQKETELLLKTSLESEKNERQRIAADLHDSVSSDLSAIRNYLTIILRGEKDEARAVLFQELKEGVEVAIENTRQVSYKLMPPMIDQLGFELALEDYFNKLSKKTGLRFELLSKSDSGFKLAPNTSYELFRIIQEFTTNMLKYGSITKCQVIINVINKVGCLEIIDDGTPYNFQQSLSLSTGTGLKNINSRLKIIEAKLFQKEVVHGNHFIINIAM